jgi:hypothetical protein
MAEIAVLDVGPMNGPRNQARISTDKFGQAYQVVVSCKIKAIWRQLFKLGGRIAFKIEPSICRKDGVSCGY